jgi:cytochrome P450
MYELSQRPEVASKLQQEISAARVLRPRSLDQIDSLNRFLNEVTRTHAALLQTRRSVTVVELDGFTFPAGTNIGYNIAAIHRNPHIFAESNAFDPDRWSTLDFGSKCRSFVPSSIGNQVGIGNNFAWLELQTTLHSLLSKWEFEAVETVTSPPRISGPRCRCATGQGVEHTSTQDLFAQFGFHQPLDLAAMTLDAMAREIAAEPLVE